LLQGQDLSGFTLLKTLEAFEARDKTENHDLYFVGVIEYTHSALKDKYFFNVFFRPNTIADIKWTEIFMYDITLNQRIEAIDQTIKLKEKILSKITHEFKTPLICVISLSEKIKSQLGVSSNYPQLKSEVKQINDLSNYTLLLINDIAFYLNTNNKSFNGVLNNINNCNFYKEPDKESTNNNQIVLHKEDVHVIDILRFVHRILETLLVYKGNSNIKPLNDFQNNVSDLIINTDPLRLKQILLNLVSNAVKFTKSGYIKLSAKININEEFIRELVISVEDTGIGIKEEDFDKLFKDFKMIGSHQNLNTMGSGLGLSISNQLAKLLGYRINMKSQYTVGTTFSLVIKLQNSQYAVSRKRSCPILSDKLTIKLDNCTFSKGTCENDAKNLIETNKRTINRLFSNYVNPTITNCPKRSKQKCNNFMPVNTSIVHISNSNINFNHYEQNRNRLKLEDISDEDSSSEDVEEVKEKSKAETEKTVERFIPVNMEEVKKMLLKYANNLANDKKVKGFNLPIQPSKGSEITLTKRPTKDSEVKDTVINYTTGIVIVDDNAMLLSSLNNIIKKVLVNNNINNVQIFSGSDGIDLLKIIIDDQKGSNIVRCVFVDEFMDFMNGTEAIKIIREYEKLNKIRPLFVAKVSAMHFEQNTDGVDMTLEKPVRDKQIQNVLKLAGILKESDK
jgi:signal transduction histidine kinase/CheY-like chemotaxis protein